MKNWKKLRAMGMFIVSLMWALPANALEIETHKQVMEKAVRGSSLDGYLRNNLGFENGVDQNVNGGIKVIEWVREGSEREDDFARWLVHYFDPLKPWSEAGLAGGGASVLWAQSTGNEWSWQNTRKYYFQALTPSNDAIREQNFANTFRALGQVAHLIQDLSVPAHTRNDAHVFYNYEKWVNINIGIVFGGTFISPTVSLSSSVEDLVPITQFWDTDSYDGTNPSAGTAIGLAEYTNPNFFSEDTIFTERLFPHPVKADTNMAVLEQLAEDGVLDKVSYVKHNVLGHRLAAASYFRFYDAEERLLEYRWYYQLDDAVYADYASFLIPRAVGYSAALINYFFRGEVEISEVEVQRDTNGAIIGQKLKVTNFTPEEEMRDGEVWVAYRYKTSGASEFTYGLSHSVSSGNLPSQAQASYDLTFSSSIPSDATEIEYTYVFKGTLGVEEGAVIGKVYQTRDIQRILLAPNTSPKEAIIWGVSRTVDPVLQPYITLDHRNFFRGIMQGTFEVYAWNAKGRPIPGMDLRVVINPLGNDTGTLTAPSMIRLREKGHGTIEVTPGNEILGPVFLRTTFRVETLDGKVRSNIIELLYTEPATITATISSVVACYIVGEGWTGEPDPGTACEGAQIGEWVDELKTWREGLVSPIDGRSTPPVFTDGAINTLYFFFGHDPQEKVVFQDGTILDFFADDRGFVEYTGSQTVSEEYQVSLRAGMKEAVVLGTEAVNLHSVEGVYLGANAPKGEFNYFTGGHFFGGTIILGTPLPADGTMVTIYFRRNLETEQIWYVQ